MDIKLVIDKIKFELYKKPEILAVYLYGSYAKDIARESSDIDIGVLLYSNRTYSLMDEGYLNTQINKKMESEIHISVINNKSPLFRYQVISPRKVLFSRNDGLRADFEVKTFNEYFDMQPFLNESYKASVEASSRRLHAR